MHSHRYAEDVNKERYEQNIQKTTVKGRESVGGYKGTGAEERRNGGRSKEK